MRQIWQLQEAADNLSQVVDDVVQHGPQIITKDGVEVAVLLSYAEWQRLMTAQKHIIDFFRESPLVGLDLNFSRDQSKPRANLTL